MYDTIYKEGNESKFITKTSYLSIVTINLAELEMCTFNKLLHSIYLTILS